VRYYRDPLRNPKRRFIGVSLEREGPGSILPTPANAATRRRLGMYATPITQRPGTGDAIWLESHLSANSKTSTPANQSLGSGGMAPTNVPPPAVSARPRYSLTWESNWSIGRIAERKGIHVRDFDRSDRWVAWRKRDQKRRRTAIMRSLKASRKNRRGKGSRSKAPKKHTDVTS
jgi:large subunit ribosomal protein L27